MQNSQQPHQTSCQQCASTNQNIVFQCTTTSGQLSASRAHSDHPWRKHMVQGNTKWRFDLSHASADDNDEQVPPLASAVYDPAVHILQMTDLLWSPSAEGVRTRNRSFSTSKWRIDIHAAQNNPIIDQGHEQAQQEPPKKIGMLTGQWRNFHPGVKGIPGDSNTKPPTKGIKGIKGTRYTQYFTPITVNV